MIRSRFRFGSNAPPRTPKGTTDVFTFYFTFSLMILVNHPSRFLCTAPTPPFPLLAPPAIQYSTVLYSYCTSKNPTVLVSHEIARMMNCPMENGPCGGGLLLH